MICNITLYLTQNCTLRCRCCDAGGKRAEAMSWEKLCIRRATVVAEQLFAEKNIFYLHRFYGSSASGA